MSQSSLYQQARDDVSYKADKVINNQKSFMRLLAGETNEIDISFPILKHDENILFDTYLKELTGLSWISSFIVPEDYQNDAYDVAEIIRQMLIPPFIVNQQACFWVIGNPVTQQALAFLIDNCEESMPTASAFFSTMFVDITKYNGRKSY